MAVGQTTVGNAPRQSPEDRSVSFGSNLPAIPERLLLAHARGEVLFVTGAGTSMPAGLPDFRSLVLDIYEELEVATHPVLARIPRTACNRWPIAVNTLNSSQNAEIARFILGEYDVVLGMLERRLDSNPAESSKVRTAVAKLLAAKEKGPAPIHHSLIKLADRGGSTTIVTTNFDRLLEEAAKRQRKKIPSLSLGEIPRPGRRRDFEGIFHIHGALPRKSALRTNFVVTDHDFGEFYLRRRLVPDFIYDAARLFHIVLVGYSANDAPMRYLLNAVAADGSRFDDVRERFAFIGLAETDRVTEEDWKGRGITPIIYPSDNNHAALTEMFARWATLSAVNGKRRALDAELRRIVKTSRTKATDCDRDLFDHLFRRSSAMERVQLSKLVSDAAAPMDWLQSISAVSATAAREH